MSIEVASPTLAALDPALPELASSFDLANVAGRFAGKRRRRVVRCSLHGTRYEPGVRCVTSYELEFDGDADRRRTIGVIELTTRGAHLRDYTQDPALPGLGAAVALATDAALGVAADAAGPVAVHPARYHPGERCVLRYDSADGHVRYGKVVSTGAAPLAQTLRDLYAAASAPDAPAVPAVAGVIDELGLVVQEALVGEPLHRLVFDHGVPTATRLAACRQAGRAMAGLHALDVPAPRAVTRADDVADLGAYLPAVRAADHSLADRLFGTIQRAGASADTAGPLSRLSLGHGSLRTDHVLLCQGGPGLIDLDGCCAAEPARDIGNLFAYLRWRAIRRPHDGEIVPQIRQVVGDEYRRAGGPLDEAGVAFFEAVSLLRIAGRRYRSLTVTEWPLVPALVDAATDLLACAEST